jgi:hypothetical protein
MSDQGIDERFTPLRPASRPKLILAFVLGPVLWLVALLVAAVVVHRTNAIGIGLIVAGASFVVSIVVLGLLRLGRSREERQNADRV